MAFVRADEIQVPWCLTIAVSSMEKDGKSHWGVHTPRPCGIISVDQSVEDLKPNISNPSTCHVATHDFRKVVERLKGLDSKLKKTPAREFVNGVTADFEYSIKNYATTVFDTETEMDQMIRLAHFGKLSKVESYHYGPPYAEMRNLWRMGSNHQKNLIILRKMERHFKTEVPVPKGFKEVPFIAQAAFELRMENRATVLKITKTRFRRELTGMEFKETDYLTMADISGCVADLQDAEITVNPVDGSTPFLRSFQGNCFAAMAKRLRPEIPLRHWL